MKSIADYDVYKLSEELSDMIWHAYDSWTEKTKRTIGIQLINASDSIAANLAEGFGRFHGKDKKRFYYFSRGSFEESKAFLHKAIRRKIIHKEDIPNYKRIVDELGPKLNAFINSTH